MIRKGWLAIKGEFSKIIKKKHKTDGFITE
jgi:hypothetical protein